MAKSVTVKYDVEETTECKGVLFEMPTQEVRIGDTVDLWLWGGEVALLKNYVIYKGMETLGAGKYEEVSIEPIEIIIDFPETNKFQFDWPITSINRVIAATEIFALSEGLKDDPVDEGEIFLWATRGAVLTDKFSRNGYSCIVNNDKRLLYGSIAAEVQRAPYRKSWQWTVPMDEQGLHWFFIYNSGVLFRKFSIELPDLADPTKKPKNVTLQVIDRSTNAPVLGASVTVDGVFMGITDIDGMIHCGTLLQGTHTLNITASGFIDTDKDDLNNETFVVY